MRLIDDYLPNYEVTVVPWGACEAHNYHMPYGTDIVEAENVSAEAARIAADWAELGSLHYDFYERFLTG